MTVVMVATVLRCFHCGEPVYSTQHEGWTKPMWWHHGFVSAECRLTHRTRGTKATPLVVLEAWVVH